MSYETKKYLSLRKNIDGFAFLGICFTKTITVDENIIKKASGYACRGCSKGGY